MTDRRHGSVLGVIETADAPALAADLRAVSARGLTAVLAAPAQGCRATLVAATRRAAASVDAFVPVAPAPMSVDATRRWLEEDEAALNAALQRLRGCAEWVATIRTDTTDERPAPCDGGGAWLRARAASRRRLDGMAEAAAQTLRALAEELAPLSRAVTVTPFVAVDAAGADLAILAARGAGPAIALRVSHASGVMLSGPWPAYSFAAGSRP